MLCRVTIIRAVRAIFVIPLNEADPHLGREGEGGIFTHLNFTHPKERALLGLIMAKRLGLH